MTPVDNRQTVPSQDPTALTTDALDRAMANLKELLLVRIDALHTLTEEKFKGVQGQYAEHELCFQQSRLDAKATLDAAFNNAKEAASKSELATIKQMDSLVGIISANKSAGDGQLNDVKGRLALLEGRSQGADTSQQRESLSNQNLIAFAGIIVGVIIAIAGMMYRSPPIPQAAQAVYASPAANPNAVQVFPMVPGTGVGIAPAK